ncbi:MAG: serine/threonine-protein kinase [Candidatus Promineifilaceae bacterium]|nr:serine/threonine-protein kinase [Candidatus Promineifilaceae bacterium]
MAQLTTKDLEEEELEQISVAGAMRPGSLLQERYKILGTLGAGGFSSVYKARDMRFPAVTKLVAIKEMILFTADPQLREQTVLSFEREASMLAVLNNPAIPDISDYFTDGDRSYLVLELIEGQNLQQWLDQSTAPIDEQRALDWALQICKALVHLHGQKPNPIIFRDLKPSNIMLDKENKIRLIDFGIAKLFEADQDRGTMIGTEGYTPPEQYRGEATPAVDIYAFGATLHHLITRQDPRQETPFTFSERPIRPANSDISLAFEAVINRCLAYDPKDRFPDAMALNEVLLMLSESDLDEVDLEPLGLAVDRATPALKIGISQVEPLWIFKCEDEIRSSTAVSKGIVFVTSYDNNIYAVTADRGELLWKFPTRGSIGASPCVYDDAVMIGSSDNHLYSLQLRSGRENWRFTTQGPIFSTPTARFDHLFFGSDDGYLYALNAYKGALAWRANAYSAIRSTPFVSDVSVVFGTEEGEIYCKELTAGKTIWQAQARRAVTSSPTMADDIVVVGSLDATVYAHDASSGWLIWRYRTKRPIVSSPVVHQGTVFIGSADGILYAIDIGTGRAVWTYDAGGQIASSPTVWKDAVYFGSTDGTVFGLSVQRGDLTWRFETGSVVIAPPLIHDDIMYVGTTDHQLYALPIV